MPAPLTLAPDTAKLIGLAALALPFVALGLRGLLGILTTWFSAREE